MLHLAFAENFVKQVKYDHWNNIVIGCQHQSNSGLPTILMENHISHISHGSWVWTLYKYVNHMHDCKFTRHWGINLSELKWVLINWFVLIIITFLLRKVKKKSICKMKGHSSVNTSLLFFGGKFISTFSYLYAP